MSSRALRKAQREREEGNNKLERTDTRTEEGLSEDDGAVQTKPNPFAMLDDKENTDSEEDTQQQQEENLLGQKAGEEESTTKASASKSKKKKKKKGKGKALTTSTPKSEELDEIDKALHSLDLATTTTGPSDQAEVDSKLGDNRERLCNVLAIDTQNLNASNEMRRLFGRVAVTTETEDQRPAGGGRRRGRGAGLAGVLAGQQHPGSRGVLSHRKNVFMQGKDTWPQATAGGLGMEVVEKMTDGTILYSFVHNTAYQDVQRQFYICVASFDPERMVQLLVHNPYHIMTLLQVHEIAIAERDYSTAGELLERALFSFGRSVHSTFSVALTQGKARLDFCRGESRELWLAGWKYIKNLGRRGTWRTAFEWAKLLLSLSPLDDPYCVGLIIDQLALRARTWGDLLNLTEDPILSQQWSKYPNPWFSIALAHDKLGQPDLARSSLAKAISNFPWVIPRLFQELNIDKIPPKLWGSVSPTVLQQLLTEMYAVRSKDIWNTPEATSLLVEVANRVSDLAAAPHWDSYVTLSQARHVILDDTPQFLSLLPKHFTDPATSPFDPLPPAGDIRMSASVYSNEIDEVRVDIDSGVRREILSLISFFSSLGIVEGLSLPDAFRQRVESRLDELVAIAGVDEAALRGRLTRLEDLSNQRVSALQDEYVLAVLATSGEFENVQGLTHDEKVGYLNSLLLALVFNAVVWHGADTEQWNEGFDTTPFSQYASFLLKQTPEFAKRQIEAMEKRFPGKGRDLVEHFIDLERPKQEQP